MVRVRPGNRLPHEEVEAEAARSCLPQTQKSYSPAQVADKAESPHMEVPRRTSEAELVEQGAVVQSVSWLRWSQGQRHLSLRAELEILGSAEFEWTRGILRHSAYLLPKE